MWRELRHAARALRKAPGFTIACVLTLAVGIGATTALFTVVYGIFLRPLPYPNPDALVRFAAEVRFGDRTYAGSFSAAELKEWQRRTRAFDGIAGAASTTFGVTDENGTTNLDGAYVSPEFFSVVGKPLLLGRPIERQDDRSAVAVISERTWSVRFGRDRSILGRPITIDGIPYIVTGVAPADFQLPSERSDIWTPIGHAQDIGIQWLKNPRGGGVNFLARLRPGFTLAQARADVKTAAPEVAKAFPGRRVDRTVDVAGLSAFLTDGIRPTLRIFAVGVLLLLVVTCANLVNLQLARQTARTREMAVHLALGASRLRIAAHALAEAVVLVAAGTAAAIGMALGGVRLLVWSRPADIPRIDAIRLDAFVLAFAIAVASVVSLVVALVPVVRVSRSDPAGLLQRGSRTHAPARGMRRVGSVVVVTETALSVALVVGAILLGNSFVRLLRTDLGVRADRVETALLDLEAGTLASPKAGPRESALVDAIVDRLARRPGVEAVAASTSLPPSVARLMVTMRLTSSSGAETERMLDAAPVTPDLFRTLGVRLLAGRPFSTRDTADAPPVVILSQTAARLLYEDKEAVGRFLDVPVLTANRANGVTVVGVVGDVRYGGIAAPPSSTIYLPFAQYPARVVHLLARTSLQPAAAASTIREVVADVDRRIAIDETQPLDDAISDAVAQPRFRTFVFGALAAIAVALAAVGLGGLIAYSASQRTAEIGIRVALGAGPADVLGLVLRESATLSGIGVLIGLAIAYAGARVLGSMLYGITAHDPASFAAAAFGLLAIGLLAGYVPARRAMRVDPAVALRAE